ncbi:MAG TPA: aspartate aminotransferase family protein [Solirubrobacteraceae bacterium]|nr:aspartate aminotransferase family protein [Solirubrobacteraceae bacterium]
MSALAEATRDHLLLHFARNGGFDVDGDGGAPLPVLVRGEGCHVWDEHGNRHLDALSALFCSQLGYSFGEEFAEAAVAQMTTLPFATNWGVAHPPAIALSERLAALAPGDINHVFFTSGGSEAVEAAWKLVRQYHLANGEPQRTKAVARDIAYHGVTLGALSFTGVPRMTEPFGRPAIDVVRVGHTNSFRREDAGDERAQTARLLREIEDAIVAADPATVAMIIAEPVQNAGGCLVPPEGYWAGLREIADRYGILLVADEVICAFGRIGEWFAVQRFGATPDLITTAKGITSAYAPMGAVLVSDRVAAPLYEGKATLLHGITFGGHPVACAVALKNLELFEREGVLENVRAREGQIRDGLGAIRRDVPLVGDVRGAGFFWALELVRDGADGRFDADEREALLRGFLPRRLYELGLVARPDDRGDSVLHLAPPLVCGDAELGEMFEKTHAVLAEASERFFAG